MRVDAQAHPGPQPGRLQHRELQVAPDGRLGEAGRDHDQRSRHRVQPDRQRRPAGRRPHEGDDALAGQLPRCSRRCG